MRYSGTIQIFKIRNKIGETNAGIHPLSCLFRRSFGNRGRHHTLPAPRKFPLGHPVSVLSRENLFPGYPGLTYACREEAFAWDREQILGEDDKIGVFPFFDRTPFVL